MVVASGYASGGKPAILSGGYRQSGSSTAYEIDGLCTRCGTGAAPYHKVIVLKRCVIRLVAQNDELARSNSAMMNESSDDRADANAKGMVNDHIENATTSSSTVNERGDHDRVVIVTGATSGMGIDLAKHLHQKGWKVAVVGRNAAAGQSVVDQIADPEHTRFFQCHLDSYASQAEMYKAVWSIWGRLDLVCANAGIVDKGSLYQFAWRGKCVDEVPPEPDLQCTDVDYKGVIYGVQLATHFMRHNATPGGKIIVNASIGGIFPHRTYPEYCGAKAAVIQYVRGVAPLLRMKENIFLNVVMPGAVATPIVPKAMIEAVSPDCLTPVSTIIAAHDRFIEDQDGICGQALEGSADKLVYYNLPEYGNGYKTKRAVTVWEPLFEMTHGEGSGLPDAIP
ncbi:15-hydroxyprostaglandin dehydrogenase [Teratosphaeria destructans]|uniref:15-hydroxyprostaglandin dehydrogenase n=1 Tax=Teratosphaeria destructans TaxID=418781 RepID=A0A9W7SML8_9PEZI|nr:15-hydroxyprostaglandin dehydrogenase [Teratosphaeria destructans]